MRGQEENRGRRKEEKVREGEKRSATRRKRGKVRREINRRKEVKEEMEKVVGREDKSKK